LRVAKWQLVSRHFVGAMLTLSDIDIVQDIAACLRKSRIITINNILALPKEELAAKAHLSDEQISHLYVAISKKVTPYQPCSVYAILNNTSSSCLQHSKISLGCPVLDSTLRGGLLVPGINEISGESGSGKTQIALQICLAIKLKRENDLQGDSLYISTEDAFPTKRLHQLAMHVQRKFECNVPSLMDSIFIEHAADVEDLKALIDQRIPALLKNSNVRLIVIDSIAALFRVEYTLNENIERSRALAELGQKLHKISHEYSTAIVCINQISDVISDDGKGEVVGGKKVVPALGLAWSNAVTVRLLVMRTPYTLSQMENSSANNDKASSGATLNRTDPVVRKLSVLFAPHIPKNQCHYVVEEEGVRGIIV